MTYGSSREYIQQWNELNGDIRIRSLANGAWYAIDLPNGTEWYWTAHEAIERALDFKVNRPQEQKDMYRDRPLAQNKAQANIYYINKIRENRYEA